MLKKNLEEELNYIKDNLDAIANNLCNIHKIASLLNKYCKTNSDNDELYEVSYLAELLEEKIGKINYNFGNYIQCYSKINKSCHCEGD